MTKKRILTLVLIAVIPLVLGAAIAGVSIWYDSLNYVKSITARVSGSVILVSAPQAGEVMDLPFEVGDTVQQGQTVATVDVQLQPTAGLGGSFGSVMVPVKAPISGTVIKRSIHVGERMAAGALILSLVNLSELYVVADVDESKVPSIQIGQPATVYLRAFDKNLPGQVGGLTPATSDLVTTATSAQPATTSPEVPVIIYFDDEGLPVYPGMSADVTITIR